MIEWQRQFYVIYERRHLVTLLFVVISSGSLVLKEFLSRAISSPFVIRRWESSKTFHKVKLNVSVLRKVLENFCCLRSDGNWTSSFEFHAGRALAGHVTKWFWLEQRIRFEFGQNTITVKIDGKKACWMQERWKATKQKRKKNRVWITQNAIYYRTESLYHLY